MNVSKKPQRKQQQVVTTTVEQRPFKRPRQQSFAKQIGAVAFTGAPEKKNVDGAGTLSGAGAGQWSPVTLVNGIAQGATANTRIGRRVTLTSMLVRWSLASNVPQVRFLVIYDHAPNGALPAIADILTSDNYLAPMNLINNDRFMVLHDENINQMGGAGMAGKWVYKRQPLQMQYTNAATGVIADITTGAIYLLAANIGTASMVFSVRTRFTDL